MKKIYFTFFAAALLCGCGGKSNGPSEAEIEKMVNERVEQRLAEKEQGNSQKSAKVGEEVSEADSRKEAVFNYGYKTGIEDSQIGDQNYYLENNEKQLKFEYQLNCGWLSQGVLKEEDKTNKEIYTIFKEGFLKGLKEGKAALD